jgi:replicative superfamily II helicase
MLDESMKRNVIVAMDTGSGKTHVAIARIQAELERSQPGKVHYRPHLAGLLYKQSI